MAYLDTQYVDANKCLARFVLLELGYFDVVYNDLKTILKINELIRTRNTVVSVSVMEDKAQKLDQIVTNLFSYYRGSRGCNRGLP
jgi:hypothetical protein